MKYELRENQGIPAPLLALMAVATGLSVANCYYNQPLLGSMAKDFAVSDFSASMVATLTQIGYVTGLVLVIPLGDLVSRRRLILTNYIVSSCALLAIALSPNIYWVWGASLLAGASSVMPQFFIPLVSYNSAPDHKVRNVGIIQSCLLIGILGSRVFSGFLADIWGWRSVYFVACMVACPFTRKLCRADEILVASAYQIPVLAYRVVEGCIGLWIVLCLVELPCFPNEARAFLCKRRYYWSTRFVWIGRCIYSGFHQRIYPKVWRKILLHCRRMRHVVCMVVGILLFAWLLAFWGNDSYLWMIIAILLIDAGMQSIHLSNQTSVVALDASAINRVNTVYMTIYFLGGSAGTFVSGLFWQHYGWTGVVGVGVAFTAASLLANHTKRC